MGSSGAAGSSPLQADTAKASIVTTDWDSAAMLPGCCWDANTQTTTGWV